MKDRVEELIVDYLNGTLSSEGQVEWNQLMAEGVINEQEIEEYSLLFRNLDQVGNQEASGQMSDNFYTMLNDKISTTGRITLLDQFTAFFAQKGLSRGGLQAAYTILILALGLGTGYLMIGRSDQNELSNLTAEVQEMKSMMMLAMLEQDSPSERIKAVSMTQNMAAVDDQVVDALVATLNNDTNTHVRLEALDALVRYAYQSKVRTKLIESLQYQESPLVQLALADIMVILQDKEAKLALEELVQGESILEDIKPLIEERIKAITI